MRNFCIWISLHYRVRKGPQRSPRDASPVPRTLPPSCVQCAGAIGLNSNDNLFCVRLKFSFKILTNNQ